MGRKAEPNRTHLGCHIGSDAVDATAWGMITHMNTTTTNPRIDYGQLAAKLDYAALDKKLDQLRGQQPPKKRKQLGDALAPVEARLRELRAKGWTYEQLANELNDFGLPVRPAALRDYLTTRRAKGTGSTRSPVVTQK